MENENLPEQVSPAIVTGDNIEKGVELAKRLADIIKTQHLAIDIKGREYISVEGWNTLGAMLGCFPEVIRCIKLERPEEIAYEAEVAIKDLSGRVVCRGIAMCSNKEKMKRSAEEYVIASMAQTRATGKAFRLAFSWIAKLAGYEATPAEEMPSDGIKVVEPPKTSPATPQEAEHQQEVTFAQLKAIDAIIEEVGANREEVERWCTSRFGCPLSELKAAQASMVLEAMMKRKAEKRPLA